MNDEFLKKYPLILIEWEDSQNVSDGWIHINSVDVTNPHVCVSVGFLIKQTEQFKIIAATFSNIFDNGNHYISGSVKIPTVSIVREQLLVEATQDVIAVVIAVVSTGCS